MSLDQFDGDFDPFATGRVTTIEVLPDGDYTFDVLSAALDVTPKTGSTILRWKLKVNNQVVEYTNFLTSQQNLNSLGADLMLLGIPADQWTAAKGKKFSVEFRKCLPKLAGIRFLAAKTSTKREATTYHNLRIKGKAAGETAMPSEADLF